MNKAITECLIIHSIVYLINWKRHFHLCSAQSSAVRRQKWKFFRHIKGKNDFSQIHDSFGVTPCFSPINIWHWRIQHCCDPSKETSYEPLSSTVEWGPRLFGFYCWTVVTSPYIFVGNSTCCKIKKHFIWK